MTQREHWEKVYLTNPPDKLGWYEPHLETSLKWIKELDLREDSNIIDVGGGASTLVDDLLSERYRSITVVDLSKNALALAKERLGERTELVTWLEEDITSVDLPARHYDLWHDRAVFHFLTTPEQQRQYRNNLLKALRLGGHLIIATFAPEAPPKCSGLPVERYSADKLENTLGTEFELKRHDKELHITPSGVEQMYLYCHFRKLK
jgi:SAM-dependent methyltransferase